MEKAYFLAIDIGASSGRHVIAELDQGEIKLEVIYRFANHPIEKDGSLVWNIDELSFHVIEGLKQAKKLEKCPQSIGIDTFGVDYVCLDSNDQIIGDVYAYRDHRNFAARTAFSQMLNETTQYEITGIQPLVFNTIYQLYADKLSGKLAKARKIMMLPCYLGYYLTGRFQNEYTISSTSGLLNAQTSSWDSQLCGILELDRERFGPMVTPGEVIGKLRQEITKEIGYEATVMAVSSHDTASAVIGSLAAQDTAFLSSGTWSLIGVLENHPVLKEEARIRGFTNEGNYGKQIRFLKNIMGLWMVQEVRREMGNKHSYSEIAEMAASHSDYPGVVDVNDEGFLSPTSMIGAIHKQLQENGFMLPKTDGELYFSLFHSLALKYQASLLEIEQLTQRQITSINIVGGGSRNKLLNHLTEKYCKRPVIAGPIEATALGNILVQMVARGILKDIGEAKDYVKKMIHSEQ
ncbi:MAG: rhamnulokinase [Candidatus Izemoplasmatales bacterium]|nr:rhamnulokinase [Candidatus Izemoplasmatales bacterium]